MKKRSTVSGKGSVGRIAVFVIGFLSCSVQGEGDLIGHPENVVNLFPIIERTISRPRGATEEENAEREREFYARRRALRVRILDILWTNNQFMTNFRQMVRTPDWNGRFMGSREERQERLSRVYQNLRGSAQAAVENHNLGGTFDRAEAVILVVKKICGAISEDANQALADVRAALVQQ